MKLPNLRSKRVARHRMPAFETVLRELTLIELRHLLEVLKRKSSSQDKVRVGLVRKEIDGRRFFDLQPTLLTT